MGEVQYQCVTIPGISVAKSTFLLSVFSPPYVFLLPACLLRRCAADLPRYWLS